MSGSYDVGGGAIHYTTIVAAAQALNQNGIAGPVTFNIYPGVYEGEIYLGTVNGMCQRNLIVFQPNWVFRPVITNPTGNGFYLMGASYVSIRRLEFTGFAQNCFGIYCTNLDQDSSHHLTIQGCYFHDTGSGGAQYANNCHHVYLIGNEVSGGNYGLRIRCSPNTYVYNNMVYGTTSVGIYTHMTPHSEYSFNSICGEGLFLLRYGSGNSDGVCMNNIFYNYGISQACVFYQSAPAIHDYNCYYAPATNIALWLTSNNYLTTLAQLQDSSRQEMNSIYANPAFIAPSDLHIADSSACFRAGRPVANIGEDFDGDLRDRRTPCIGCDEIVPSDLILTLSPVNPPILIPGLGGYFQFDAQIENTTNNPLTFDAWTEVILPTGVLHGPLIIRTDLTISPGQTLIRRGISQYIPGYAPPGDYSYVTKVGNHPGAVIDSDSFPFSKFIGGKIFANHRSWTCAGFFGDELSASKAPSEYTLFEPVPNPFNPTTTLSFYLPEAGDISLKVFDTLGREVALIAEGWYPSGAHQAVFDAAGLASGVYITILETTNNHKEAKKIIMLK